MNSINLDDLKILIDQLDEQSVDDVTRVVYGDPPQAGVEVIRKIAESCLDGAMTNAARTGSINNLALACTMAALSTGIYVGLQLWELELLRAIREE